MSGVRPERYPNTTCRKGVFSVDVVLFGGRKDGRATRRPRLALSDFEFKARKQNDNDLLSPCTFACCISVFRRRTTREKIDDRIVRRRKKRRRKKEKKTTRVQRTVPNTHRERESNERKNTFPPDNWPAMDFTVVRQPY